MPCPYGLRLHHIRIRLGLHNTSVEVRRDRVAPIVKDAKKGGTFYKSSAFFALAEKPRYFIIETLRFAIRLSSNVFIYVRRSAFHASDIDR